jgi:hypothetical protein
MDREHLRCEADVPDVRLEHAQWRSRQLHGKACARRTHMQGLWAQSPATVGPVSSPALWPKLAALLEEERTATGFFQPVPPFYMEVSKVLLAEAKGIFGSNADINQARPPRAHERYHQAASHGQPLPTSCRPQRLGSFHGTSSQGMWLGAYSGAPAPLCTASLATHTHARARP